MSVTIVRLQSEVELHLGVIASRLPDFPKIGTLPLINSINLYRKMRKFLGSKRNEMSDADSHHFP